MQGDTAAHRVTILTASTLTAAMLAGAAGTDAEAEQERPLHCRRPAE